MISISSDSEFDNEAHYTVMSLNDSNNIHTVAKQDFEEEDIPFSEPSAIETGSYVPFREKTIYTMKMSEIQGFNSYSFHN